MSRRFMAFRLHEPVSGSVPQSRLESLAVEDLSPGNVIIRVAYSSINYKDALMAAGRGKILREYPRIGGVDFTGTVESSDDARFQAGDPVVVYGFGIGVSHDGGHTQVARIPADWVMPLPQGITLLEAAVMGVAGYTSALALHQLETFGLKPGQGPVAVSGATGGSGSLAVAMMAARGYELWAMSGKPEAKAFLQALGAHEVVAPGTQPTRPLESARWAGAIDTVGGEVLASLIAQTKTNGLVAAFGNAAGNDFTSSVLPFILRGVKLIGVNGASPLEVRQAVWQKIASIYRPRDFAQLTQTIGLQELPEVCAAMLARRTQGRYVIDMSR